MASKDNTLGVSSPPTPNDSSKEVSSSDPTSERISPNRNLTSSQLTEGSQSAGVSQTESSNVSKTPSDPKQTVKSTQNQSTSVQPHSGGQSSGQSSGQTNLQTSSEGDGQQADDVVTETKIVGVTETGVIRKRSFKRRLTEEEKSKRYGQSKEDYAKIAERVMGERWVSGAVESLQERWKMISFMHEDCMTMVRQWEGERAQRLKLLRQWNIRALLVCLGTVVMATLLKSAVTSLIW